MNSQMMTIRNDIAIKYYLDLHNEEDGLSDKSVLFTIISYLLKTSKAKTPVFKFSSKTLKYIFGERLTDETFKADLVKSIKALVSAGDLTTDPDAFTITKSGLANFYLVND